MDISFLTNAGRFNLRTAALIINENKLLIMRDQYSDYYYLPGGRVKMNESSEAALIREIKEELRFDIKIGRMLWINENFFYEENLKQHFHEICFFYSAECADEAVMDVCETFTRKDTEAKEHIFCWIDTDKIKDYNLYPSFIKERIKYLPKTIEHIQIKPTSDSL